MPFLFVVFQDVFKVVIKYTHVHRIHTAQQVTKVFHRLLAMLSEVPSGANGEALVHLLQLGSGAVNWQRGKNSPPVPGVSWLTDTENHLGT